MAVVESFKRVPEFLSAKALECSRMHSRTFDNMIFESIKNSIYFLKCRDSASSTSMRDCDVVSLERSGNGRGKTGP